MGRRPRALRRARETHPGGGVPSGVTPLARTLLLDLTAAVASGPTKIEGVAVWGPYTVAVANDNDFGVRDGPGAFDAQGRRRDTGVPSRLLLHLPPH